MLHSLSNKGFTIVELMIVLLVTGILIGVIFTPLEDLYSSNSRALKTVVQTGDVRNTLRSIESQVVKAISYHNTNTIVTDPSGSNNNTSSPTQWDWRGISGDGTSNRVLITSTYATTILPELDTNGTRTLVYATDCVNYTSPLENNVIYFVKNSTLYRRTLANTTSPCPGYNMAQQTSCAAGVVTGACASAPRDAKLLENVTSFTVDYYLDPSSTSATSGQYNAGSTAPSNSQTIVISLTAGTGSTQQSSTMRITRLNGATS